MNAQEYRAALASLGLAQEAFARMVGASPRTGQKWGLGETRIPGPVVMLLRLMLKRPDVRADIEAIGAPATLVRAAKRAAPVVVKGKAKREKARAA
jgi:hypothetical protein